MELIFSPISLGYPSFMGPGVPKDRVAALRQAFAPTMRDPEFARLLQPQSLPFDPISGDRGAEDRGDHLCHAAGSDRARPRTRSGRRIADRPMICLARTASAIAAILAALALPAAAQDNTFYSGRTINIYIGTGEGPGALTGLSARHRTGDRQIHSRQSQLS